MTSSFHILQQIGQNQRRRVTRMLRPVRLLAALGQCLIMSAVHLRQFDCVSFDNAYTSRRSICSNVSLYYTLALHLAAPRAKSVVYGFILLIFMLAASSANRNVTVWCPSVCPCLSVPSAYSPSLTRGNIPM